MPNTAVVDVVDGGADLRFRFWGSGLVKLYEAEMTGKLYSESVPTVFRTNQIDKFRSVIANRQPMLFATSFNRPNGMPARRLNLRLPFLDATGTVDNIMTVAEINGSCAPQKVVRIPGAIKSS